MNLRKHFIKFFLIAFFIVSLNSNSFSIEPDKFIQSIVDQASKVLVKNLSKEVKMEKLKYKDKWDDITTQIQRNTIQNF